jgi:ATP/maltotriose-dependent transcriptional regulator MalT
MVFVSGHVPNQRRVVHRSRVLSELEDISARTILLVAPAGYGKTTVIHQWLERSGGACLTITSAARDTPVLARELSAVLATIACVDPRRTETALGAARTPLDQARAVARTILAQVTVSLDTWLVIDDYQLLSPGSGGVELIALLEASERFRVMIASRERPGWATSRRFVHLDIVEFGPPDLALDDQEVAELIPPTAQNAALCIQARGWPAVIALAAHSQTTNLSLSSTSLAESLYDYFAEELYERAPRNVQRFLMEVALLPPLSPDDLLECLTQAPIMQALETGLVQRRADLIEVHPLARTFLLTKARKRSDVVELAQASIDLTLARHLWDEAFELIKEFALYANLERLLLLSFSSLIESGRIVTLETFGQYAAACSCVSQEILDLIAAEVALKDGAFDRALALGTSVAASMSDDDPLKARSLIVAGEAARLEHRLEDALRLHTQANRLAVRTNDLNTSAWGRCLAALYLESETMQDIVLEFEALHNKRPEDRLRLFIARYIIARLEKGFCEVRVDEELAGALLAVTSDPWVRTGWRSMHGNSLMLQGRYEEARAALRLAIEDVDEFGLSFARPHIEWSLGATELGLRQFTRCEGLLRRVERAGAEGGDVHLQVNARVLRARLHLAQQDAGGAVRATTDEFRTHTSQAMYGEYLATRAVALAVMGERETAVETAARARGATNAVETRVLAASVDAIIALGTTRASRTCEALLATTAALGTWDGLVCAVRSERELLVELVKIPEYRSQVHALLLRSNDSALARSVGLDGRQSGHHGVLSVREGEVLDLIRLGLKNREIAAILFIGTSTVKTHVDNILSKLGARTRAEAVARYAEIAAASGETS